MSDIDQWEQLRAGKQEALEQIYRNHVDLLFSYGCKFSQDESLIKDCIQDLFIELWKNHSGLSSTSSVKKYLLASIRRKIIKTIHKNKKWLLSDQMEKVSFDLELATEERMISEETNLENVQLLKEAFESLSKREKEVIYLKYYADLDYEEIGDIMDVAYQSLRNLVSRALKKMKENVSSLVILLFLEKFSSFFEYKRDMIDLLH